MVCAPQRGGGGGSEQQRGLRIHHILTKEHIDLTWPNKMRKKLAEQVLNKDMLYLM